MYSKEDIKLYLDPKEKGYISLCDIIRILSDIAFWFILCGSVLIALSTFGLEVYKTVLGTVAFNTYIFQWYDWILVPFTGACVILMCILIAIVLFLICACIGKCLDIIKCKIKMPKMCKIKVIKLK